MISPSHSRTPLALWLCLALPGLISLFLLCASARAQEQNSAPPPLDWVIMYDVSGSIDSATDPNGLRYQSFMFIAEALRLLYGQGSGSRVVVIAFGDDAAVATPFQPVEQNLVLPNANGLDPDHTNFERAFQLLNDEVLPLAQNSQRVILISDGESDPVPPRDWAETENEITDIINPLRERHEFAFVGVGQVEHVNVHT